MKLILRAVRILVLVLMPVLVLVAAGSLLLWWIPGYLQQNLLPTLGPALGLDPLVCQIRRLDWRGADLANLTLGRGRQPILRAETVRVDTSPAGLLAHRLDAVRISGVEVRSALQGGQLVFPGHQTSPDPDPAPPDTAAPGAPDLPVAIDRIEVRHAVWVCRRGQATYRIPFEFDLFPDPAGQASFSGRGRVFLRGQALALDVRFDPAGALVEIEFRMPALTLARFGDLLALVPGLSASGQAKISGRVRLGTRPWALTELALHLRLSETRVQHGLVVAGNGTGDSETPLEIALQGVGPDRLKLTVGSLGLGATGIPGRLDLSFDLQREAGRNRLEGRFGLNLEPGSAAGVRWQGLRLSGLCRAQLDEQGQWQVLAETGPPAGTRLHLVAADADIRAEVQRLHVAGSGQGRKGSIECDLQLAGLRAAAKDALWQTPLLAVQGRFRMDGGRPSEIGRASITVTADGSQVTAGENRLALPRLGVRGEIRPSAGTLAFQGEVAAERLDATVGSIGLKAGAITLQLPLRWPAQDGHQGDPGRLRMESVQWRGRDLGRLDIALHQSGRGLRCNGSWHTRLLPGLNLGFDGQAGIDAEGRWQTGLNFDTGEYRLDPPVDLGGWEPALAGVMAGGRLRFSGNMHHSAKGPSASTVAEIRDGRLLRQDPPLEITGLNTRVTMPQLPAVRSLPGQQIRFDRLAAGKVEVSDGRIDFQVESERSFLVEKGVFRWCNGKVFSQAVRVSADEQDYDLTFYCDRLNLARLLEQVGAMNAQGSGTVNGRIPLRYRDGRMRFDDGFLFSTPGDGGKIQLTGTEMLTAGIPSDSVQFAQLELAREALKDYDYHWVKLRLASEQETLLLTMQMDGKPAHELPFVYQPDLGGFAKVGDGKPGSIFQGISLDVNFRLPLDRLLAAGTTLQKVLDHME